MQKHKLQSLIEPVVEQLGYELVRVITMGQKNPTLQIMIDRKDGKNVVVEDCAKVSRALSETLDEKDPISEQYNLEVSSPGIDRPLTKLAHFEKFQGFEVKVETSVEVDTRKRFKGELLEVKGSNIIIDMDGVKYSVPFDSITKAKLVINDELLQAAEEIEEE